ncbi:amino acid permease [Cytobacillus oceanisediminis]|jgi:L-asparagine transporter-like permease|uniref:amino acid permease n=1 Tax=Cytobacillus oceanisediminis TaxID=665099 RepID=UPI0001F4570D|nr:amino acid permease [Cytobacillus oceanisediminis]EFV75784.1 proline-specific permease [Bacillus sp. 2_A_57_CT2]MBY0156054.1 amino acid permease [Cytobacillus firmus]MBU8771864.1 amino acid permease [Cytobacillus oceanisediminis]MCM3245749.1 amino acid permease [Cytobacillus oceanisediminis]MCM3404513.1 amino acid permease [Cytobacillus oceanisediminis]
MDFFLPSGNSSKKSESGDLKWWQLSLIGVGCTIGTGFFLGSAIGIKITGPSIVFSFMLAALGTYIVYNLLAKMTAEDPQEGSFCYYANKAYGKWAGFSCGWNYWCSNILIMGSQLTALSILTRFWFPHVPLWVFAAGYAILSIIVVLTGNKGFDKVENLFAVIKTAAIIMFIILAAAALSGVINGDARHPGFPGSSGEWFPEGFKGFWSSLIYAFYAYGGIEVIGLMATRLKKKEDAPKAGIIMLIVLVIIYVISLGLAVYMASHGAFNEKESPFVTAMDKYNLAFFPHVFNAAIIIAGFSTMTASLFGVTALLVTLADDGDAPAVFSKKIKKWKDLPLPSLGLATAGLIASIVTALLLPGKIYEYITTAAGILILFNWSFIIISALRILENKVFGKIMAAVGLLLILAAVSGTLIEKSIRFGFFVSLIFVALIAIVALIMQKKVWKKEGGSSC